MPEWLLLVTPEAEPLVGRWRAEHDWAARDGVPAHVTVRTPFLPPERWADPEVAALARFLPLHVTLARLEDRPGALVVLAEPDDELRRLTDAVSSAWPDLAPHKDGHPDVAYHVTVVRTPDDGVRSQAWDAIAPHLPAQVAGTALWASTGSPEDGVRHAVVARQSGPQ